MTYTISLFPCLSKPAPILKTLEWDALVTLLGTHHIREQKDGQLFSPASYAAGKTRSNENVGEISLLVLDFDNGFAHLPFLEKCKKEGIAAFVYSSFSSRPGWTRWRAVLPLSSPVPASEWTEVYAALSAHFGMGQIDASCKDVSRAYFTPSCPSERAADAFTESVAGEPIDAAKYRAAVQADAAPVPLPRPSPAKYRAAGAAGQTADVETLLRRAVSQSLSDGRNNSGLWLAGQLRDNNYTESEATSALSNYQKSVESAGSPPYTARESQATLRNAYSKPARAPWSVSLGASREEIETALQSEGKSEEAAAPEYPAKESEPASAILNMRQSSLTRHLKGIAEVTPYGGLQYRKGVSGEAIQKSAKVVIKFYGQIDNAKKFDLVDTLYAALSLERVKHDGTLPWGAKGRIAEELFGKKYARQVLNWIYDIGIFAENLDGRRRPHIPFRVHAAIHTLPVSVQEQVFNAYEKAGYLTDENLETLIIGFMPPDEATPDEARDSSASLPVSIPPVISAGAALDRLFSCMTAADVAALEQCQAAYGKHIVSMTINELLPEMLHELIARIPAKIDAKYRASLGMEVEETAAISKQTKTHVLTETTLQKNAVFEIESLHNSVKYGSAIITTLQADSCDFTRHVSHYAVHSAEEECKPVQELPLTAPLDPAALEPLTAEKECAEEVEELTAAPDEATPSDVRRAWQYSRLTASPELFARILGREVSSCQETVEKGSSADLALLLTFGRTGRMPVPLRC